MAVNINDVGILKGLRNAVIALNEFDRKVKAEADALRKQNASLTKDEATNVILMDEELRQMLSMVKVANNNGNTLRYAFKPGEAGPVELGCTGVSKGL